jgi:hypothetical protein
MSVAARRALSVVFALAVMMGVGVLGGAVACAEVVHHFEFAVDGHETPAGTFGFSYLGAVALDQASGDVWITEWRTGVVYKFDAAGKYTGVEITGTQVSQGSLGATFSSGIAVDNSSGPNKGDLYVAGTEHGVVYKFDSSGKLLSELSGIETLAGSFQPRGVAIDSSGDLYVADSAGDAIDKFDPSGKYLSQVVSPEIVDPATIAVDSAGNVYLVNMQGITVKLEPNGGSSVLDPNPTSAVAVDPENDHVYVAEPQGYPTPSQIAEYDASGDRLNVFGKESLGNEVSGVAVRGSTGEVYVANYAHNLLDVFGPAVVIPDTTTEAASNIHPTSATFNGTVNPDGTQVTECRFEYGTDTSYRQSAPCEQAVGSGTAAVSVSASLSELSPDTTYHFRLLSANIDGTSQGTDMTLTTTGPPRLDGEWAANVASTSATLNANVNPLWPTNARYRLEYGASTSYGQTLSGSIGEGPGDVLVSYHLQEFQPGTIYHYRIVAFNEFGTVTGLDHTFMTQVAGGEELTLPDGRVWELVSPPDKGGALIENYVKNPIQAANDGSGITYGAFEPIGENPKGKTLLSQIRSMHDPDGWRTQDISLPHPLGSEEEMVVEGYEYRMFSPDLSFASIQQGGPLVGLSSVATEGRLYVRNNIDESFSALLTAANVPSGTKLDGEAGENILARESKVEYLAATPDISHIILESPLVLTPDAPESHSPGEQQNLYEWEAGKLQLLNVLPNGHSESGANLAGEASSFGSTQRAISSDGRRVAWIEGNPAQEDWHLYVRDTVEERTVQVGGLDARFQAMSSNGSIIFFLEGGDLYELNLDTGTQTDITASHKAGETSAGVKETLLGVSDDGSLVYFVANGVLASGGVGGQDNLYIAHDEDGQWTTSYIATLSSEDEHDWYAGAFGRYSTGGKALNLAGVRSRVSPDGRYLEFMSSRSLTGYDSADVNSGRPDQEVYLYDERTGRLVCASCDPTGARPEGVLDTGHNVLMDRNGASTATLEGLSVAGMVPGWGEGNDERSVYQPRYLSNSGRLFFDSPDALVPQDTNGLMDVYEYEPAGVGSCATTRAAFSERSGGCVNLISAGTSNSESAFFDASENGDDVFFLTSSRLAVADYDTSVDVYDAHVCSQALPCVPMPVSPPPCTSGDSCKAAPSPQPAIFGPTPSATFNGTGNVLASPPGLGLRPKSLTRAQKLARALTACRKKPRKTRARCKRQARKDYPVKQSRKANATSKGKG